MDDLTEILGRIGEDDTPFEFDFFTGRKSKKSDDIICGIGPASDNLDFFRFFAICSMQADFSKQ